MLSGARLQETYEKRHCKNSDIAAIMCTGKHLQCHWSRISDKQRYIFLGCARATCWHMGPAAFLTMHPLSSQKFNVTVMLKAKYPSCEICVVLIFIHPTKCHEEQQDHTSCWMTRGLSWQGLSSVSRGGHVLMTWLLITE